MSVAQALSGSLKLLEPEARRRLVWVTIAQVATSMLDLLGILLIGVVGAVAVTTVQGLPPPPAVESPVAYMGLDSLSSTDLLLTLSSIAAIVLLVKSLLSTYLIRRVFLFLASRQAAVSARLAEDLLSRPLPFVQKRSSQQTSFALVQGATSATLVMLGQGVVFVSELALLLILGTFLMFVNPLIALTAIAFFGLVAVFLQLALGRRAMLAGQLVAESDIASLDAIQEAISAYREITVFRRRGYYVARVRDLRWQAANSVASLQFISTAPKYVFEVALVVSGFALAGFLFSTSDAVAAAGTLALFLAAATRVTPSILRLQTASLGIRNAAGLAESTIELADSLRCEVSTPASTQVSRRRMQSELTHTVDDFEATVVLRNVSFTYPDSSKPAVKDASLQARAGTSLAIVGTSGAGKSTLADLILGVLQPQSGAVMVGGLTPSEAITRWPGQIAYVPQDVSIANSTIRANVALGLPREMVQDDLVWEALDRARLSDAVMANPEGLSAVIGERGVRLSGGQRQRLGIARALYLRPRLLVLDEATSALDVETEQLVTQALEDLEGAVTTVIVAHRLSTIRNVDQVVYIEDGVINAAGPFDAVRAAIPAFDRQAKLMGLR